MNDVKAFLAGIFALLAAVSTILIIGFVAITGRQEIQICLDHPTYPKCNDEWSDRVVVTHN